MLICWIAAVATLWRMAHPLWDDLLTMGFTEIFLGRAAAIAQATQIEMNTTVIVLFTTHIDIMTVFLLFPILTLSYRSLFKESFYQKHMKPVFAAATKSVSRFSEAKVAGVFLFVWFPFWGTGVVVGAILGYLLDLRTWVNMLTVSLGTLTAILCWVFAYDKLFTWLGGISNSIPAIFTGLLLAALIVWNVVHGVKNAKRNGASKRRSKSR